MDARTGIRSPTSRGERLSMIADILGCSIEHFLNGSASKELDDTAEMFRLWSAIDTEDGRRAALNVTRAIVEAQDSDTLR